MNELLFPTLLLSTLLFFAGYRMAQQKRKPLAGVLLAFAAAVAFLPATLFTAYYFHFSDNAVWFYRFRSIPLTELWAAGAGLAPGLLVGKLIISPRLKPYPLFKWIATGALLLCFLLLLAAPYAKPAILPLALPLHDQWKEGVCIQSTPSTCGPSSAATLLRFFGKPATEEELARECFTYSGGTENWYLARAFRRRGFNVDYWITPPQPDTLAYPSITGTQLGEGGAGHFIAVLGKQGDRYIIGDPLSGRFILPIERLKRKYYFTGFFMIVRPS
jgi:hypothetical protein